MDIPTINAETRKAAGSRAAARLRRDGKLPAIVYGHKEAAEPVALDYHAVNQQLQHGAHLVNLQIGGKTQPCLFKDAQYDYLGSTLLHLDLARVDLSERVKVHVPIEFRGTPAGVKEGGVLRRELKELEIECLVTSIPENLRVNVEHLGLNEVLYAKDIELAEGMVTTSEPDTVVATVRPPLVAEEPTEEAPTEGATTEPEVIARGKEETEEGKDEA